MNKKGTIMYRNDWNAPPKLVVMLEGFLKTSKYPIRTGRHLEYRIGMFNFSIWPGMHSRPAKRL